MTGEECFGVVVRSAGLFIFVFGLWHSVYGVAEALQSRDSSSADDDERPGESSHLGFGTMAMMCGLAFGIAADRIVELLY